MGERLKPTQQYPRFEAMTQQMWGVSWGINSTRHAMIGLMREFLKPSATFLEWDRAVAASSDHSLEVETAHYAIQHSDLPRLSSSNVWEAREVAHQWWEAIGALNPDGPHPLPLRSRPVLEVEDLSTKILKSVEEMLQKMLPSMLARAIPTSITGESRSGSTDLS